MRVLRIALALALLPAIAVLAETGAGAAASAPANTLAWSSCADAQFARWKQIDGNDLDGFDCADFVRPLDRAEPDGKLVHLAVVRFPATGTPAEHRGTLFLNPGGPGQSGVGLSKIVYLLPPSVRAAFDFVTYDPRGIGASTPALAGPGCAIPKPDRPATGAVQWSKVLSARQRQVSAANAKCFAANRALVEHAGTVDGAYDLDALRQAVGDDKLTYWGISYGTMLGSTYAQLFPDKVRVMAFDGNMNPQTTLAGITTGADAPDHSIGFFLQANGLQTKFDEVIAELDRRTIALPNGERYTRWDLLDTLNDGVDFFPIAGGTTWAQSTEAVEAAWDALFATGAPQQSALTKLTDKRLRSPATGTVGSLWSAVVCQDFSDRLSDDRQQSVLRGLVREGPRYGGSLGVDYLTTCNGYDAAKPHPVPRPTAYGPPIPGIISNTTRDGETPYQWAVNMARTYPTMRSVTLVGGIHGTFGIGQSQCVDDAIAQVLVSATSPVIDAACQFSPPSSTP